MNRGRQNGKRLVKRNAKGQFLATKEEVEHAVEHLLTGTTRVVLDPTVPGGVRYEHTPGTVPNAGR